tara:strand:+ start:900 stop:1013 length:114 start_codon:yes stop_codon:yes gene_type:complete
VKTKRQKQSSQSFKEDNIKEGNIKETLEGIMTYETPY